MPIYVQYPDPLSIQIPTNPCTPPDFSRSFPFTLQLPFHIILLTYIVNIAQKLLTFLLPLRLVFLCSVSAADLPQLTLLSVSSYHHHLQLTVYLLICAFILFLSLYLSLFLLIYECFLFFNSLNFLPAGTYNPELS